jgi:hypothetical protein
LSSSSVVILSKRRIPAEILLAAPLRSEMTGWMFAFEQYLTGKVR